MEIFDEINRNGELIPMGSHHPKWLAELTEYLDQ